MTFAKVGQRSVVERALLCFLAAGFASVLGCGSGSSTHAGAISITDPNGVVSGQLTSLAVTRTARLAMTPVGDKTGAGIDWTVTCGGSPLNGSITGGACGTLSPAHTSDTGATIYTAPSLVPYLSNVTITASVTSDPGANSVLILPIVALPISITFGDSVASVQTGQVASFEATALNDASNAGVTWTATCSSADCGSFNPTLTHTDRETAYTAPATIPTGGTVTVTATSVADTTKSASVVVSITSSVAVTIASPLATLNENAKATLSATVANDASNAGVNWSVACGSAGACGSFNLSPAHTKSSGAIVYTAPAAIPAGSTVTITVTSAATNASASASDTVNILAGAPSIAFVQTPPASVVAQAKVPVSAVVTNDVSQGGVTWSVQCGATDPGACGYVTPYRTADNATAMYVAPPVPPNGTVTIVATAAGFSGLTASSAPVAITASTAISINFVPFAPAQLTTAQTVNLTAAVTNDATNAGVDWQVCASGCGFFTTQAAIAEIPATPTTPLVPAVPAVTATTVQGWPNGLAIPYTAPNAVPQAGTVAVAASAHANAGIIAAANVAITSTTQGSAGGPALTGVVQAGTLPVAGATVSLYAAGTAGYGSASTLITAPNGPTGAVTDSNGNFTLTAGYTCPVGSQVYLVALGGTVGANSAANPNLSMMTALGPCSNLSATPVVINEVTTVASVWPLAPFSTNQPLTGLIGYLNIGASSSNALGLANAFASVNNLVDVTTGQPLYTVPVGDAAVPYVEINTIADMLNACTATTGGQYGDGSACGTLFAATSPLYTQVKFNSTAAADTIQSAFNIAQHPSGSFDYGINIAQGNGLYSLVTPGSAFLPLLPSAPQDLSISLHYTGGGLTSTSGASDFAFDANSNLWIAATAGNEVVEWNSVGATVSPAGGYTGGGINAPGPIAIDPSGNVWVSNADSLTELTANGSPAQLSPYYGVTNGLNMAIDGLGNIWITNPNGVTKFNSVGEELSPVGGYTNSGVTGIDQLVIDQSNDIWLGNRVNGGFSLAELGDSNGLLVVDAPVFGSDLQTPMVADASGNIWSTPGSELCELPPYGGTAITEYFATCSQGGSIGGSGLQSIFNSNGIAIDGAGNLFIANSGDTTQGFTPNLTEIVPSQVSNGNFGAFNNASLGVGTLQAAVDGSGNVWVLLSDSTITEYVGIAAPAVTPISAALQKRKLGKTP